MRKAVLSPFSPEHRPDLPEGHNAPLDQARDHADMLDDRRHLANRFRHPRSLRARLTRLTMPEQITPLVESPFLRAPLIRTVVGHAAHGRLTAAMTLAAPERTAQIIPVDVGGFGQEENTAMTTTLQVAPQVGLASQNRSLSLVIRQNKIADRPLAIPVRAEIKKPLDLYCKKPSVSLMMLMVVSMSPFYSIDAFVSSDRTGAAPFSPQYPPHPSMHASFKVHAVAQFR